MLIGVIFYYIASILYIIWIGGRETILEEQGCTVKLLFIKRFYAWDEFKTKCIIEHEHLLCGGEAFIRCAVFTKKKKFKKPKIFSMVLRTLIPRSLSYIVIGIGPAERLNKSHIDEELFYEKMNEWGVTLEKAKI